MAVMLGDVISYISTLLALLLILPALEVWQKLLLNIFLREKDFDIHCDQSWISADNPISISELVHAEEFYYGGHIMLLLYTYLQKFKHNYTFFEDYHHYVSVLFVMCSVLEAFFSIH